MSKTLISLAAAVVTAAFAVSPAAAKAAPAPHHWYFSGVEIPEGAQVPTIAWGTLNAESEVGKLECMTVLGGFVENPVGGSLGVGAIQAIAMYDCVWAACPGEFDVIPEGLPWYTALVEVAGVERDRISRMKIRVRCEQNGTVLLNTVFSGNTNPVTRNGTAPGKPSFLAFTGPGEEQLRSPELATPLTIEGALKTLGYNGSELITEK